MNNLSINGVIEYVEQNISVFHEKRISKIGELKLKAVLQKKNPYLFKAKYLQTADSIVKELLNAYISSSEETMFGDWLEGLAIFINQKVHSGWKSGIKGIDLEFDNENRRYIVSIKSGPNWGNSSQIEKMINNFNTAKKTLRTSNSYLNIVCVNGCCYGKDSKPDKGSYYKYCGQAFWEFIGGNENVYTDIIEPLGYKAKERNDDYMTKYCHMINRFTKEFIELFCEDSGNIDWNKLVRFNSEKD
ncbi:MAG: hypothetical protein LBJ41_07050 [Treponema sp.]|jgi:hypothetical protein|nr:hypothetical protein [Treponema sp.]